MTLISTFDHQPIWSGADVGGVDVRCRPPYRGHFQTSCTWSGIPILAKAPSESPLANSVLAPKPARFLCVFQPDFFMLAARSGPDGHSATPEEDHGSLEDLSLPVAKLQVTTSWRPPEVSVGGDPHRLKSVSLEKWWQTTRFLGQLTFGFPPRSGDASFFTFLDWAYKLHFRGSASSARSATGHGLKKWAKTPTSSGFAIENGDL